MTNPVQRVQPPARVAQRSDLEGFLMGPVKEKLASVCTKLLPPDRLIRVALASWSQNPTLQKATRESFMLSLLRAGQMGLDPSGALGQAYLVPYSDRKKGTVECQLIIGYRGLIELARRSGQISSLDAYPVYAKDRFKYRLGTSPTVEHEPYEGADDPGPLTHSYAVAVFKDGGCQFRVLPRRKIDAIMRSTQSRGEWGPWKDHYDEMATKTAIRALSKYLPMSIEFRTAVEYDDEAEYGRAAAATLDITPPDPEFPDPARDARREEGIARILPGDEERASPPTAVEPTPPQTQPPTSAVDDTEALVIQAMRLRNQDRARYDAAVGKADVSKATAAQLRDWIRILTAPIQQTLTPTAPAARPDPVRESVLRAILEYRQASPDAAEPILRDVVLSEASTADLIALCERVEMEVQAAKE